MCKNIFAKYFLQISPEQPQPTNLPPPPPRKKGLNLFIRSRRGLCFLERIETPDFVTLWYNVCKIVRYNLQVELSHLLEPCEELCARLDGDALPLLFRGVVVLLPWLRNVGEKSRINPSVLNLPGNHLRWRCHCRRVAQKWCAKACLDAPIWQEKICNLDCTMYSVSVFFFFSQPAMNYLCIRCCKAKRTDSSSLLWVST